MKSREDLMPRRYRDHLSRTALSTIWMVRLITPELPGSGSCEGRFSQLWRWPVAVVPGGGRGWCRVPWGAWCFSDWGSFSSPESIG